MKVFKNLTLTQVQALAQTLAGELKNQNATIGLIGNLGSGKTTFTKAFAKALGIKKTPSPTFVIMHEHPTPQTTLYHLDLYRLKTPAELLPLGLSEIMEGNGPHILMIEWVEKFPQLKKSCDVIIKLRVKPNNLRDVQIQAN